MISVELPNGNKFGTVRRLTLRGLIARKLMQARCIFHYTDDYAYDASVDYGRTEWLPCEMDSGQPRQEGVIYFVEHDFKMSTGRARKEGDGLYRLNVHGNLCYELRLRNEHSV